MSVVKRYNPSTSQWEEILVGIQGPQGAQGPQGPQGPQGATGAAGTNGKILQVVSSIKTGVYSVAQTTPTAAVTDLTVTITPSATTSKIFLILDIGSMGHTDGGNGAYGRIYRDTTALNDSEWFVYTNSTNPGIAVSTSYLDSPSTTSSTTYRVRVWSGAGTVRVNGIGQNTVTFGVSKFTAIEVGA